MAATAVAVDFRPLSAPGHRIITPKDVYILPCEHVTLPCKRDLADGKDFEMGGWARMMWLGPASACESLTRAFSRSGERQREMWPWTEEGSQGCNMAGFDKGGRGPRATECGQLLEAAKDNETNNILEPSKRTQSCHHLDLGSARTRMVR